MVIKEVKEHFQNVFLEQGSMEVPLEGINVRTISEENNAMLIAIFSKKEIMEVI